MARLRELFPDLDAARILDVGGSAYNWRLLGGDPDVTLVNLTLPDEGGPSRFRYVIADGTRLPFADQSFDLVLCNSVIEHLGSYDQQELMASEVARVGKSYFVQTPNRWFLLEPHYMTPCVHFLPKTLRARLVRNFTIWGLLTRPDPLQVSTMVGEIRLLTAAEMRRLFPSARHLSERFLGLRKALLAVRV